MINFWCKNIITIYGPDNLMSEIDKYVGKVKWGVVKYQGEPRLLTDIQEIASFNSKMEAVENIDNVEDDILEVEKNIDVEKGNILTHAQLHTFGIEPQKQLIQLSNNFPDVYIANAFSAYDIDGVFEVYNGKVNYYIGGINKDNVSALKKRLGDDFCEFRLFYLQLMLVQSIQNGNKLGLDDVDKNNLNLKNLMHNLIYQRPSEYNKKFVRFIETGHFL